MENFLHDISWVVSYRSPLLTSIFEAFTWLGYATFLMMLLPLGYWLWSKKSFTNLTILVVLSIFLNGFLKDFWQNPRPDAILRMDEGVGTSFGMPSGHAQIAAVLWFGLAMEIAKRWAWSLASFLVLGICCSRIYLGVHDLEDILMGLLLAFLSLAVYYYAVFKAETKRESLPLLAQLSALVVLQVVLAMSWPLATHSKEVLALIGFLFGWILGENIERSYIRFELKSKLWVRPAAAAIGLLGMVLLLSLLKPVIGLAPEPIAPYIQTTAIGLYMAALAPLLFQIVGISRKGSVN